MSCGAPAGERKVVEGALGTVALRGQDLGHDWHRGCGGERALRQWTRCGLLAIVLRRRMHVDWGRR